MEREDAFLCRSMCSSIRFRWSTAENLIASSHDVVMRFGIPRYVMCKMRRCVPACLPLLIPRPCANLTSATRDFVPALVLGYLARRPRARLCSTHPQPELRVSAICYCFYGVAFSGDCFYQRLNLLATDFTGDCSWRASFSRRLVLSY